MYKLAKIIFFPYYHLLYRMRVKGADNLPKEGPVIVCANHISLNDPIVIGVALKRPVNYLAKSELFRGRFVTGALKRLHAIPITRDAADMNSFRAGMAVLEKGGVLGIFAQGRRMDDGEIKDAKAGVALYALKSGAQVVPLRLESRYKLFSKIRVRVGEPVDLSEFQGKKLKSDIIKEAADIIFEKINEL